MTDTPPPFQHIGDLAAEVVNRIAGGVAIERVAVRPIRSGFAFVSIRLPGVMLQGIEASRDACGHVTLKAPTRRGPHGREWPIFALQPGTAEAAAAVVARHWPPDAGSTG